MTHFHFKHYNYLIIDHITLVMSYIIVTIAYLHLSNLTVKTYQCILLRNNFKI